MFLIRGAEIGDYRDILKLARHLNSYNLPAHGPSIRKLIRLSIESFGSASRTPGKAKFLFVAENLNNKRVVGCSLLIARHGSRQLPHLSFQLDLIKKRSRTLKATHAHYTLKLKKDTVGFTEIGGLVILPAYRSRKIRLGKQLSYARFAYIARRRERFCRRILVEYLPRLDARGGNAFWSHIGYPFTLLSYEKADRMSAENKEFILSLFPQDRIYCSLLPDKVTGNLGVPGRGAAKSLHMLTKVGFRFLSQIDPFDGGPNYGASTREITLVRNTVSLKYKQGMIIPRSAPCPRALVLREHRGRIRAVFSSYSKTKGVVALPPEITQILKPRHGESLSLSLTD